MGRQRKEPPVIDYVDIVFSHGLTMRLIPKTQECYMIEEWAGHIVAGPPLPMAEVLKVLNQMRGK